MDEYIPRLKQIALYCIDEITENDIDEILKNGSLKAKKYASLKMKQIRENMKINYYMIVLILNIGLRSYCYRK